MVERIKNIIKKASSISKTPLRHRERIWPSGVLNYLEVNYNMRPQDLRRLWYLRRTVRDRQNKSEFLFIYDWVAAREQQIPVKDIRDLRSHNNLLRFNGHILRNGTMYIEKVGNYTAS